VDRWGETSHVTSRGFETLPDFPAPPGRATRLPRASKFVEKSEEPPSTFFGIFLGGPAEVTWVGAGEGESNFARFSSLARSSYEAPEGLKIRGKV